MKKIILSTAVSLAITGCASTGPNKEVHARISEEMSSAVSSHLSVRDKTTAQESAASGENTVKKVMIENRFNVAMSDAPAKQFFYAIAEGTPYNMVVHPDVNGVITAHLKAVTLIETLDIVRDMYGYDYRIEANRITIKPLTAQMRVFKINYLTGSRTGTSDTMVSSGSVTDSTSSAAPSNQNTTNNNSGAVASPASQGTAFHSSKINTVSNTNFWKELKENLETLLSTSKSEKSVVVSPQAGLVVVKASAEDMRNVAEYLRATQNAVERQVMLEAKILEVQLSDQTQTGINWAAFSAIGNNNHRLSAGMLSPGTSLSPLGAADATLSNNNISAITGSSLSAAGNAANSILGLAFQTSNFAALLNFLDSQGTVHVLSSPRIATLNNQKALLKIGTEDFFVTNVSTTTTTGTATTQTPNVTLQPFFSGIALDVTPQIADDGNIVLHIHPAVSQVTTVDKRVNLGGNAQLNLPLASSNISETDSIIRGQNGRIFAIGGLMRVASSTNDSRVPGASDIPVISTLFKNNSATLQKRELVILIKPTIIENNNMDYGVSEAQERIMQMAPTLSTKSLNSPK